MPYVIAGATVYGIYKCKRCGAIGEFTLEADEYADGTFGLMGFECPECYADLDDEDE